MASTIRGDDDFDSSDAGTSTTNGDVGTYVFAGANVATEAIGSTRAGSTLHVAAIRYGGGVTNGSSYGSFYWAAQNASLSGTWRRMGGYHPSYGAMTLWVRIS